MNDIQIIAIVCFLPFYVGMLSIGFYIGKIYAIRFIVGKNKGKRGNENAKKE